MKLCIFMTYGGSFKGWKKSEILDRELEIYHKHAEAGWRIDFISYGDSLEEVALASRYPYISIHYNYLKLHPRLYAWILPLLHSKILRTADVYKTNQMYGAHVANRCALLWKKPVVVRQGYGHYENRSKEYGRESIAARQALRYERKNIRRAKYSICTTEKLANTSVKRHALHQESVSVIPNYVVPETWTPAHSPRVGSKVFKLVYFGRLSAEKNLASLLEAVKNIPLEIQLIGDGPLKQSLQEQSLRLGVSCRFSPPMPQTALHNALAEADAFVLPSLYEGHPKALIEALAFGIPVLASDCPGIREVIGGNDFAITAQTSSEGLKGGVEKILALLPEQRAEMGQRGREWALSQFSVNTIAAKERTILEHAVTND